MPLAPEYFEIAANHALDGATALTPQEVLHRHVGREVSLRYLGRSQEAAAAATVGEVVLLSPACASFDAFRDFEHRGDTFRELVEGLR